jgi:hypothetical protein
MKKKWFFIVPAAIVGMVVFVAVGGSVVQYLWNWLLPAMFGWHTISFWQALGLLVLCRLLFGGSGWHRAGRGGSPGMARRWQAMTPEERERFRQGIRERCGMRPAAGPTGGVDPAGQ